jgi:hypothetical protein
MSFSRSARSTATRFMLPCINVASSPPQLPLISREHGPKGTSSGDAVEKDGVELHREVVAQSNCLCLQLP